MRPQTRDEFEIAIICALPHEADAVEALFDEKYASFSRIYGKHDRDPNVYANGRLGQHHVVLCCMPGMGTRTAASVASSLRISYPRIRLALLVGICGVAPFPGGVEIMMGDVIISDSVIEYDLGSLYPDGFRRKSGVKDTLGRPDQDIRTLIASLRTHSGRSELQQQIFQHLRSLQSQPGGEQWQYPGAAQDVLFNASYRHKHYKRDSGTTCICFRCKEASHPVCDEAIKQDCASLGCAGTPVYRRRHGLEAGSPRVHIGSFASANSVMKSGIHRDKLVESEEIIAFEMEGAGVWDSLPCVIIKGACDYADSHKSDKWQSFAAATGASGAKAFLEVWTPSAAREGYADPDKHCLADLLVADPRDEKIRIEKTKGGLLQESFFWVLDHPTFKQWYCNEQTRLLWIRGDAGKGKTMLMIGITDELTRRISNQSERDGVPIFAYFLCQSTDSRLNNSSSILRGLIYLLGVQRPSLLRHLRHKHEHAGRRLFESPDSFYSLSGIFTSMIGDTNLSNVFLSIDAIDECESGLPQLLGLITQTAATQSKVKWVVSSRNRDDIERHLGVCDSKLTLRLELNSGEIAHSINNFIDTRVTQLLPLQSYPEVQCKIKEQIREKSDGTFLWAALVVDELRKTNFAADALEVLEEKPAGLVPLFGQMMDNFRKLPPRNLQRCMEVLSVAALCRRPLHLLELRVLANLQDLKRVEELDRLVSMCGSFLTVVSNTVYFIHQSARDYLEAEQGNVVFAAGHEQIHRQIYFRSLKAMSDTLRQDICDLRDPGPVTESSQFDWRALMPIKYSCLNWFYHLCHDDDANLVNDFEFSDGGALFSFFTTHLLHWFEALGLMKKITVGIQIIQELLMIVEKASWSPEFHIFLHDSMRLALTNAPIIETAPLQLYNGALIFSPEDTTIKRLFWKSRFPCVKSVGGIQSDWPDYVQILEGHKSPINAVCFSSDAQTVATASRDHTIKIWDATTGLLKQSLEDHDEQVNSIAFLQDAQTLASASDDGRVLKWNLVTQTSECILKSDEGKVSKLSFSPDPGVLFAGVTSGSVLIWNSYHSTWRYIFEHKSDFTPEIKCDRVSDAHLGVEKVMHQFHEGQMSHREYARVLDDYYSLRDIYHSEGANSNLIIDLTCSLDGQRTACAWTSGDVRLWCARSNAWADICQSEGKINSLAFSTSGSTLAVALTGEIQLWDTESYARKKTIPMIKGRALFGTISFLPHSQDLIFNASSGLFLWNSTFSDVEMILPYLSQGIFTAIAIPACSRKLAVGDSKGKIYIWSTGAMGLSHRSTQFSSRLRRQQRIIALSALVIISIVGDGATIVMHWIFHRDKFHPLGIFIPWGLLSVILYLSTFVGKLFKTFLDPTTRKWLPGQAAFIIRKLGFVAGIDVLLAQPRRHLGRVSTMALSPDHKSLATGGYDGNLNLWNTAEHQWKSLLKGHENGIQRAQFSPDGGTLVSVSEKHELKMWDAVTGACRTTWPTTRGAYFSPDCRTLVSVPVSEKHTMKIWDVSRLSCRKILKGHKAAIRSVHFAEDGDKLASISEDCTVRLWDTVSGKCRYIIQMDARDCAWAPDGQSLALTLGPYMDAIHLWDLTTRSCKQVIEFPFGRVEQIAVSTEGWAIAALSKDRTISLWDVVQKDWKPVIELDRKVNHLSFSADDQHLDTDRGKISLHTGLFVEPDSRDRLANILDISSEWIVVGKRKLIWIPFDYRATSHAVYHSTVSMGHESGHVTFLELEI